MPKDLGDWAGTAEFVLGANFAGKDLKDVSAIDKARAQDRNCRDRLPAGPGHADREARRAASAVAVDARRAASAGATATPSVETPAGRIAARAAIITVSSNVLTAGNIKFAPDIPKRQLDAAARLSLGSFDHIALQLPGNPLGLRATTSSSSRAIRPGRRCCSPISGASSLCSIDVGGSFGRDLSAQGETAMVAFAMEWLTKLFGSDIASAVRKSSATRWNAAPLRARRDVVGRARRAGVAQDPDRAGRLHVSRRRSDP